MKDRAKREGVEAVVLSFIGGMLDIYCLDHFNIFATMHTGNTIRFAANLAEGNFSALLEPGLIMIFFGIGIYIANIYEKKQQNRAERKLLLINSLLLILAILIPVDDDPLHFTFPDFCSASIFGIIGALLIHSFIRFSTYSYSATMMTANINRLVTTVFKRIDEKDRKYNYAIILYILIILSFMVGVAFCHYYLINSNSRTSIERNLILLIPSILMLLLSVRRVGK
ncbi:MAG: DUF1275 domain-containing protein [Sphaerochaetaceae bacterium]|nr:DUF1275 domain-containing protein [Sphaerochaetaceae bacterium]